MSFPNTTSDIFINPLRESINIRIDSPLSKNSVSFELNCIFTYSWDFIKNDGVAHLKSINDENINLPLFPITQSKKLDFISDTVEKSLSIYNTDLIIKRIILEIVLSNMNYSAGIILHP